MKRSLFLILLLLFFADIPARNIYRGLDSQNPVIFSGNSIQYKGKTIYLDEHTIYVDGNMPDEMAEKYSHVYKTFREAARHLIDGTEECPMRVFMAPYVYWADDPDKPEVLVGKDGREPFGMTVKCENLHLIGLTDDAENVVVASKRGHTMGALGNFTMLDFWGDGLQVSNMTLGNFCNVDLYYRLKPGLSIEKRSVAITQAHVAYCHGDRVVARNVRFISRLNMNPLNGAKRILFDRCYMECTDDALTGNGVYLGCTLKFYGQKPFYTTHCCGAVFLDCDFTMESDNDVMAFCKKGGPVTLVNCRYHAADSVYLTWTNYPADNLRCFQAGFTMNGKPYTIGSRKPCNTIDIADLPLLEAFVVSRNGQTFYNIANLLHGDDGWNPMESDIFAENPPPFAVGEDMPSVMITDRQRVELTGGGPAVTIKAVPMRHGGYAWRGVHKQIVWKVPDDCERYVRLSSHKGDSVVVESVNDTDETAVFCIEACTEEGLTAAVEVVAKPVLLPQPLFMRQPHIVLSDDRRSLSLRYSLALEGRADMSEITWYRADNAGGEGAVPVVLSRDGVPETTYPLTAADNGCWIIAGIVPRHVRSRVEGDEVRVGIHIDADNVPCRQETIDTDFRTMPTYNRPDIRPGYWTLDGYKPEDTREFEWTFDSEKEMWTYDEGFNGAVGKGLVQAQRGARLMYEPVACGRIFGDMRLVLLVDPAKTAGQGFGSATKQYMDVCLKFDPHTLTGYALRIIRTVKHAKAVDFMLVKYDNGHTEAVTEPVTAICYRTGCTISLEIRRDRFVADVKTDTPLPADSSFARTVHLEADVEPNIYGGFAIQHTGSCGESITMLHRLRVEWSDE